MEGSTMAKLTMEWVSVEKAQQWLNRYDPRWLSNQILDATVKELRAGKKHRWYNAILVNQNNICVEGLTILLAITKAEQGAMCWVARADDFHFSEGEKVDTPQGPMVVFRKMDTVDVVPLTMPYETINDEDLPPHLRSRS
jgi:hypothetical protein